MQRGRCPLCAEFPRGWGLDCNSAAESPRLSEDARIPPHWALPAAAYFTRDMPPHRGPSSSATTWRRGPFDDGAAGKPRRAVWSPRWRRTVLRSLGRHAERRVHDFRPAGDLRPRPRGRWSSSCAIVSTGSPEQERRDGFALHRTSVRHPARRDAGCDSAFSDCATRGVAYPVDTAVLLHGRGRRPCQVAVPFAVPTAGHFGLTVAEVAHGAEQPGLRVAMSRQDLKRLEARGPGESLK